MFTSIDGFLRYFRSVNKRDVRDVAALPPEADGWRPEAGEGENAWSINQLIGHMAGARPYFASAYRGEGWISPPPPEVSRRALWVPALEESAQRFEELVSGTPDDWLERRVEMIDTDGTLVGWRILMMMLEHDVHHRSQIDTYAGLNGWEPPDIYGRSAEQVGEQQHAQRAKHGRA